MIITSRDNETIKEIIKLKEKKYRKERFIVEGIKMVKEAILENANIDLIVMREDMLQYEDNINQKNNQFDIDVSNYKTIEVTEKIFSELTDVETPQGILAVIKKPQQNQEIDMSANYILALDGVQDPGNLGTILRTADSANLKQIIVTKNTVDSYSPKVVRSTMGSIYRIKVIEVDNLVETMKKLNQNGFETVTTALSTDKSIYDINYNKKVVIIGNEANGVSKEVQDASNYKVKIPMLGKTESLNASIATGIMIYEYVRQQLK